jgi:hypothetical protein
MKHSSKLHLYAIAIATWCHVLFFATKILYDLFKATRANCSHMWHLWLKNIFKKLMVKMKIPCNDVGLQLLIDILCNFITKNGGGGYAIPN